MSFTESNITHLPAALRARVLAVPSVFGAIVYATDERGHRRPATDVDQQRSSIKEAIERFTRQSAAGGQATDTWLAEVDPVLTWFRVHA